MSYPSNLISTLLLWMQMCGTRVPTPTQVCGLVYVISEYIYTAIPWGSDSHTLMKRPTRNKGYNQYSLYVV